MSSFDDETMKMYEPKGSRETDDWSNPCILNTEALLSNLGQESPVYIALKQTGEDFLRARMIVRELILNDTTSKDDIPDNLADEVCEALASYARSPSSRFFNSYLFSHGVVTACLSKRIPKKFSQLPWTDAQFNAVVTYAYHCQFISVMNGDEDEEEEIIGSAVSAYEGCLKARPSDARMHVMYGNFLMIKSFTEDARQHLEKALEMDEEGCFGAHYTIANILDNVAPDLTRYPQLNPIDKLRVRACFDGKKIHLEKYLDVAPTGHWHVHRAALMLLNTNLGLAARGTEKLESVCQRLPEFAPVQLDLFDKCVAAFKLYVKCYGREKSDFKTNYKSASSLVATLHKVGFGGGRKLPQDCEYICAGEGCTANIRSPDVTLRACKRCQSVLYCGKKCQTSHWKVHKKDCSRLAKEYEVMKKSPKHRNLDVKVKEIGEEPSEWDSLFES